MLILAGSFSSCEKETKEFLIDLSGEPDKVIENVPGTMFYHKELKAWYVRHSIPGSIDSVDNYLIAEMPVGQFPFEEGKQVVISGFCYRIPDRILADKGIDYPAGIEYYYIKVSNFN